MLSAALLELTGVTAQQTCSIIDIFLKKYLEASLSRYVLFFKKMLAIKSIIDISKCFYEPPWYQNTLPKWYKVKVNFTVNVKLSRQFFRKSILSTEGTQKQIYDLMTSQLRHIFEHPGVQNTAN